MAKDRIKYIDIAKGIGIFLVIWGHFIADGFIDDFIYSFHMPLFLVLSGYMLRMRNVECNGLLVKKRMKQLIIPYFAFSVAYLIWEFLVNGEGFVGLVYMTYQTVTFRGMAPLWFLASLFFAELLFLWLMKWSKTATAIIAIGLCFAHAILGKYFDLSGVNGFVSNPVLFLVRTSLCVPFVACGYSMCAIMQNRQVGKVRRSYLSLGACIVLIVCACLVLITALDANVHLYEFSDIGVFMITAVMGSVGILVLSIAMNESQLLEWIGKNSMMLMALHYPFTQILKNYLRFDHWAISAVTSFVASVLLIGFFYLLCRLISKTYKKHS